MNTLVSKDVSALMEVLEQIYAPGELLDFPQRMFNALQHLLPDAVLSLETMNMENGSASSATSRAPEKGVEEWRARILELLPTHPTLPHLTKDPRRVVAISDCITQRQFKRTALYNDVMKPMDVAHQLVVGLQIPHHVAGMTISRDRDFSEQERQLVQNLAPHLALAHIHAQNLTTLRNLQGADIPDPAAFAGLGLTPREAEVLHWIVQGKRDAEIAEILRSSPRTIQKHVQGVLLKLGVETRTAASTEALRRLKGGRGIHRE